MLHIVVCVAYEIPDVPFDRRMSIPAITHDHVAAVGYATTQPVVAVLADEGPFANDADPTTAAFVHHDR